MNRFNGEYICGNKFRDVADHIFEPNKYIPLESKIVYCKTDNKDYLLQSLLNTESLHKMSNTECPQVTIITHNSDYGIDDEFAARVPSCVKHWYAQNCDTDHPKFTNIPIGLANPEWPHGDFAPIQRLIDNPPEKKRLAYFCANLWTNPNVRRREYELCSKLPFCLTRDGNWDRQHYLQEMAESKFVFCPLGNGIDTCRLWEALYLGCIPIIENNKATKQFREMRILYYQADTKEQTFKNWTTENLEKAYDDMMKIEDSIGWPVDMLDMQYWRKRILNNSENFHGINGEAGV